jgi:phage-related protein
MEKIAWIVSSYKHLTGFPPEARKKAGVELNQVQHGRMPSDWKSMTAIGIGVIEIRLHEPHEHRVLYVAKFNDAVYVLHAFSKKHKRHQRKT